MFKNNLRECGLRLCWCCPQSCRKDGRHQRRSVQIDPQIKVWEYDLTTTSYTVSTQSQASGGIPKAVLESVHENAEPVEIAESRHESAESVAIEEFSQGSDGPVTNAESVQKSSNTETRSIQESNRPVEPATVSQSPQNKLNIKQVPFPEDPNTNHSSSNTKNSATRAQSPVIPKVVVPEIVIPDETETADNSESKPADSNNLEATDIYSGTLTSLHFEQLSVETTSEVSWISFPHTENALFPLLSWRTYDNWPGHSMSYLDFHGLPGLSGDVEGTSEDNFDFGRISFSSLGKTGSFHRECIYYSQGRRKFPHSMTSGFMDLSIPVRVAHSQDSGVAGQTTPKTQSCLQLPGVCLSCVCLHTHTEAGRERVNRRQLTFPHFRKKPMLDAHPRRHTNLGLATEGRHLNDMLSTVKPLPRLHDLPAEVTPNPDHTRDPIPEDIFEFIKILGAGSYGKVHLARLRETKELVAVKVQLTMQRKRAEVELKVLQMTHSCPFLVSLHSHFSTMLALYIVMEYVPGGKLTDKLTESFSLAATAFYSAQIILALCYLHGEGVLYRDLKPDNVMMTLNGYIKVCDFGSCFPKVLGNKKVKVSTGTPRYWAPEKFHHEPYGRPSDWWSLGVILYQMLTGEHPFKPSKSGFEAYKLCVTTSTPDFNRITSSEADSLCRGLLAKDPDQRLGGPEEPSKVYEHSFYKHFIDWKALRRLKLRPPPMYSRRTVSMPVYARVESQPPK